MAFRTPAALPPSTAKPKPKPKTTTTTMTTKSVKPKAPKRPKLKWRTRDSQNSQLYNLQLDINDLQQEISHLRQVREILSAQQLNRMDDRDGSYVKVVREYHRVFQHGFHAVVPLEGGERVVTMEFLSRVMDPRVSIGRFVGLDMMRDQWARYSTALRELDLRYISSRVLPEMDYVTPSGVVRPVAMVSSEASYESVFSVETIELMFPHLLQHRSVVNKLLGRKFRGIAHFDFVFDTNSHRVIGYDFRLDFFEAFARLLHDPEDLCLLFEGAKISEEFLIGDLNVYPQTAESNDVGNNPSSSVSSSGENSSTIGNGTSDATGQWSDPVANKYATSRSRENYCERQLHSKLTNILDPVDRAPVPPPAAPFAMVPAPQYVVPTAAAFPQQLNQQQQLQQMQQQQQQVEPVGLSSRPSHPWQLQLTSILSSGTARGDNQTEDDDEEETKSEGFGLSQISSMPRLPSISYFSAAALASRSPPFASEPAAPAQLLGKRSNPFASEFESFSQ